LIAKIPVSVVIPTLNEGKNLKDALLSVQWADEVIVVDSFSVDQTAAIAKDYGALVVEFSYAGGLKKKNWALSNVNFRNEWVFLLDADERATEDLAREIAETVAHSSHDGYCIDREFNFMGRSLRCFRPNWNLRLFKHRLGRFEDLGLNELPGTGDNEIHEHVLLQGSVGLLQNAILHNDYRGLTEWIDRHNKYSTWEAHLYQQLRTEPLLIRPRTFRHLDPIRRKRALKRVWIELPLRPVLRFIVWYFGRRGFLDGFPGLAFCILMSGYEFLIGLKERELRMAHNS
jgi:glycosyltransferase involved in cell wall biosynthesis